MGLFYATSGCLCGRPVPWAIQNHSVFHLHCHRRSHHPHHLRRSVSHRSSEWRYRCFLCRHNHIRYRCWRLQTQHLPSHCRTVRVEAPPPIHQNPEKRRADHCRSNHDDIPYIHVLLSHDQCRRSDRPDWHGVCREVCRILVGIPSANALIPLLPSHHVLDAEQVRSATTHWFCTRKSSPALGTRHEGPLVLESRHDVSLLPPSSSLAIKLTRATGGIVTNNCAQMTSGKE